MINAMAGNATEAHDAAALRGRDGVPPSGSTPPPSTSYAFS